MANEETATLPPQSQPPQPPTKTPEKPVDAKPKTKFGATYIFRLRKQIQGPFPNLWELAVLDEKTCKDAGVKKIISDADALTFCLDNLQGEFEADGL